MLGSPITKIERQASELTGLMSRAEELYLTVSLGIPEPLLEHEGWSLGFFLLVIDLPEFSWT